MAAANGGSVFEGAGPVLPVAAPVEGIARLEDVVIADLPAARGFSGAPVVDTGGNLVGIAAGILQTGLFDTSDPAALSLSHRRALFAGA